MSKMFCSKNEIFLISKSNLYKLSRAESIGGFISFKHHFAPIYFIMSWFWHEVSSNFQTNFKNGSLQIQVLCLSLSSKCFRYFLLKNWTSEIESLSYEKKQFIIWNCIPSTSWFSKVKVWFSLDNLLWRSTVIILVWLSLNGVERVLERFAWKKFAKVLIAR